MCSGNSLINVTIAVGPFFRNFYQKLSMIHLNTVVDLLWVFIANLKPNWKCTLCVFTRRWKSTNERHSSIDNPAKIEGNDFNNAFFDRSDLIAHTNWTHPSVEFDFGRENWTHFCVHFTQNSIAFFNFPHYKISLLNA